MVCQVKILKLFCNRIFWGKKSFDFDFKGLLKAVLNISGCAILDRSKYTFATQFGH